MILSKGILNIMKLDYEYVKNIDKFLNISKYFCKCSERLI